MHNPNTDELLNKIEKAEEAIRSNDFNQSLSILSNLENEVEQKGRITFDLGNIALFTNEYQKAIDQYIVSLDNNYHSVAVYLNYAIALERTGEIVKAKNMYEKALSTADENFEKQQVLHSLINFYCDHDMIQKAEKLIVELLNLFPQEYYGYHLQLRLLRKQSQKQECIALLEEKLNEFQKEPLFWKDYFEVLEDQGKYSQILHMIDENPVIMETIPEDALREKTHLLLMRKNREKVPELIHTLFWKYGQIDAAFCEMLLAMMDGDFVKAGAIANLIIDSERERQSHILYITMYLDIQILYLINGGKPSEEVLSLMKNEAMLCRKWVEQNNIKMDGFEESLQLLGC